MSRQIKDPISGSWLTTAGYNAIDNVLDPNSSNPVQNQAVANPIEAMLNVYGSKNLLPNTATTQIVNGITFTVNSDGSVTASGSVTQGEDHATLNLFLTPTSIPAGFILTGCPAGGSDSTYRLDLTKATGTIVAIKDFGEGAVTTENLTYDYARIIIWEGAGNVNLTFYPMIRDSRITDPTYVPYAMSNRELTEYVYESTSFYETKTITQNQTANYTSVTNELYKETSHLCLRHFTLYFDSAASYRYYTVHCNGKDKILFGTQSYTGQTPSVVTFDLLLRKGDVIQVSTQTTTAGSTTIKAIIS